MLNEVKSLSTSGKSKLFVFLFLSVCIIPNLLFAPKGQAQFTQQGPKLVGTGVVGLSEQGSSVAISSDGNTAVVGGIKDNSFAGAVWVFTRSGGVWTQQGPKLVGTGAVGSDVEQGSSVAISSDGNTFVEGGRDDNGFAGAVWVFTRSGGVWTQQGPKLVGTGAVGSPVYQGTSVAISSDGNTIIEGAYNDNNQKGAVWVFTRSGGVWTQQGSKLVGSGAVGNLVWQGTSVGISSDGNSLCEGGYEDNSGAGAVWIFTRSGGVWTQQGTKLVGTGSVGSPVYQGISVRLSSDGNTLAEGGYFDNNGTGAVWIFTRSGGIWTQIGQKLVGNGAVGAAEQGISVAISPDGNNVVEGGFVDNTNLGAVWVFTRSGGVWTQLGNKLVGTGSVGSMIWQGISTAISSEGTIIEGGYEDNNTQGAVWVFTDPTIGITPISNEVPNNFSLYQNYPNPFNPNTVIKFNIPLLRGVAESRGVSVQLKIYDVLGREVSTLVNQNLQPGSYEVNFDGTNLPSGVYFYKLVVGDPREIGTGNTNNGGFSETKKMMIVK